VAPTRHWVACGSNSGVGGVFSFYPFLLDVICPKVLVQKLIQSLVGQVTFNAGHCKAFNTIQKKKEKKTKEYKSSIFLPVCRKLCFTTKFCGYQNTY